MSRMGTSQTGLGGIPGSTSTPAAQGSQTINNPNFRNRVAMRAYEKWQKRGGQSGSAQQDWLEAERELLAEQARQGNTGSSR